MIATVLEVLIERLSSLREVPQSSWHGLRIEGVHDFIVLWIPCRDSAGSDLDTLPRSRGVGKG
jgi:hypothetical protein